MTRVPLPLLCTVLVALLASIGCSTKVREADGEPGFAADWLAEPVVAIGGVSVDPSVGRVLAPTDSLDAVEALYSAFLGTAGFDVWPPSTVAASVPAETLQRVTGEYATYGRLRPDHVTPLADYLVSCRYLALGRLLEDRTDSDTASTGALNPEDRIEGQPERHSSWAGSASISRKARVSIVIFDLTTGEAVWRGEADSHKSQLYEYESDDVLDLQERLTAGDQPLYIARTGDALKTPDLIAIMQSAFTKLVGRLPAAGS